MIRTVEEELSGERLDKAVKELFEIPWSRARHWIGSGKISVDGSAANDPGLEIFTGQTIVSHIMEDRGKCIRGSSETSPQIRIHMSEDGHPLLGEKIYMRGYEGSRLKADRLMLHASKLGFLHPVAGAKMIFEAPLPDSFQSTLKTLGG